MKTEYNKPFLSYQEQLGSLLQKGLIIEDKESALQKLKLISYYRLSAYFHPFKQRVAQTTFRTDTTFEEIIRIYEFDHKLRLLLTDALGKFEIALKCQITNYLAERYGAFGYLESENFNTNFTHESWIGNVREAVDRSKNNQEEFIKHYEGKYNSYPNLPIWMLTEIMTFGTTEKLYYGLKTEDQHKIAISFGLELNKKILCSWLKSFVYIRNICAHHSRLWNRNLSTRPIIPKNIDILRDPYIPNNNHIFTIITFLLFLYRTEDEWRMKFKELIEPFIADDNAKRKSMGFPEDWKNHPLWK